MSVAENHHLLCSSSQTARTSRSLKKRIDFLLMSSVSVAFLFDYAKVITYFGTTKLFRRKITCGVLPNIASVLSSAGTVLLSIDAVLSSVDAVSTLVAAKGHFWRRVTLLLSVPFNTLGSTLLWNNQRTGAKTAALSWESPSTTRRSVTASQLFLAHNLFLALMDYFRLFS